MAAKCLQQTIAKVKGEGYATWVVEKWQSFFGRKPGQGPPGVRVDMFNLIDLVAIRADVKGVLGVQACAAGDLSDHQAKAMLNIYLPIWKAAGNRFVIQAWGLRVERDAAGAWVRNKDGSRSKRKIWTCNEVEL